MSYFRNIFSKLYRKDTLQLGRWNINYSEKYIERITYLANYDNCGPCGSIQPIEKKNIINTIDERKTSL